MSPVDVVNIALQEIGSQASISSFDENSTEAIAASILYQPKVDAIHRSAHWNCARFQSFLTVLAAAPGTPENPDGTLLPNPPMPWLYEYAMPADCLKARWIVPVWNNSVPAGVPLTTSPPSTLPLFWRSPPVPFYVSSDNDSQGNVIKVILTNMSMAQLVYTRRIVNPDLWDAHFLQAVTSYLGCWLVNAIARNKELFGDTAAIAKDMIAQARISDGNEGWADQNREASWIQIRGSGFYATDGAVFYSGWDGIGFPNGSFW